MFTQHVLLQSYEDEFKYKARSTREEHQGKHFGQGRADQV